MTSDNTISAEAREKLASAYIAAKKPWFASVIRNSNLHQFDIALSVLTEALQLPVKYCKYDLPGIEAIDKDCNCSWCKSS